MSESDSGDGSMRDREVVDAWLSAAMDDELGAEEREALASRVAVEESVAARARALHEVDSGLREIARTPDAAARIEADFEALRARLAEEGGPSGVAATGFSFGSRSTRRRVVGSALAAAAVAVLYLVSTQTPWSTDPERVAELAWTRDGEVDPNGVDVDPHGLSAIPAEDLDVIEQLDLLDYLAARETEGRG